MKLDPREGRHVLRQCDFGALATHSVKVAGYPFVSHVPLALDGAGRPLLLLSRLAEHSKNLAADPRASLMATPPGEGLQDEIQAQPRLTLLGDLRPAEVEAPCRERYLRYHRDAADYLGFGDFRFYRLDVMRVRLVAGFAQAGWIEPEAWLGRTLAEDEEAALLARLQTEAPAGWDLLGVDWEGLDLRVAGRGRQRLRWPHIPVDGEALVDAASSALALGQANSSSGKAG
jgi:heme oxygenase (biliverdin-IX-beta and delta-forming)